MRLDTACRYAARRPTHPASCLHCGQAVADHTTPERDYCVRLLASLRALSIRR